ncbi:hypothetical protein EXN66_Car022089 [Channa argus]|uniref:Uncharacterized protein n=1 Tax=Channa argus TaxID=215402 RepID=A0A6G1QV77_CHAAH|nr:hypothetical protein EXN66_Car022089 [Channa argus]
MLVTKIQTWAETYEESGWVRHPGATNNRTNLLKRICVRRGFVFLFFCGSIKLV